MFWWSDRLNLGYACYWSVVSAHVCFLHSCNFYLRNEPAQKRTKKWPNAKNCHSCWVLGLWTLQSHSSFEWMLTPGTYMLLQRCLWSYRLHPLNCYLRNDFAPKNKRDASGTKSGGLCINLSSDRCFAYTHTYSQTNFIIEILVWTGRRRPRQLHPRQALWTLRCEMLEAKTW